MANIRRGERIKSIKRPFSPVDDGREKMKRNTPNKKAKPEHIVFDDTNSLYDLDPSGNKFECKVCKSNYIVNPLRAYKLANARRKRANKRPTPRYIQDQVTMEWMMVCNACGLKLSRPVKERHIRDISGEEKKAYMNEVNRFTDYLMQKFNDKDAENIFCPNGKHCGCVQSYILEDKESEDIAMRAGELLQLYKEARYLSGFTAYSNRAAEQQNTSDLDGNKAPKIKVGLGNGQKKSDEFLNFVMEKREHLRNKQRLCEKACKKILGYSNNLLYKKLKTENNLSRIECNKNLVPVEEISKQVCCVNNCVALVNHCESLIVDWRSRALMSQTEQRRVIAEILTPVARTSTNCYKFVQIVLGCSPATICKVAKHLKTTGWDREPPEHGLKKYWETQQLQSFLQKDREKDITSTTTVTSDSNTAIVNSTKKIRSTETSHIANKETVANPIGTDDNSILSEFVNRIISILPVSEIVSNSKLNSLTCIGNDSNKDREINENNEVLNKETDVNIETQNLSISKLLPKLEKKREEILRMQKSLETKQTFLKSKQEAVEKQLMQALQHQKMQYNKEKRLNSAKQKKEKLAAVCQASSSSNNNRVAATTSQAADNVIVSTTPQDSDNVMGSVSMSDMYLPVVCTLLKAHSGIHPVQDNNLNVLSQHLEESSALAVEYRNIGESVNAKSERSVVNDNLVVNSVSKNVIENSEVLSSPWIIYMPDCNSDTGSTPVHVMFNQKSNDQIGNDKGNTVLQSNNGSIEGSNSNTLILSQPLQYKPDNVSTTDTYESNIENREIILPANNEGYSILLTHDPVSRSSEIPVSNVITQQVYESSNVVPLGSTALLNTNSTQLGSHYLTTQNSRGQIISIQNQSTPNVTFQNISSQNKISTIGIVSDNTQPKSANSNSVETAIVAADSFINTNSASTLLELPNVIGASSSGNNYACSMSNSNGTYYQTQRRPTVHEVLSHHQQVMEAEESRLQNNTISIVQSGIDKSKDVLLSSVIFPTPDYDKKKGNSGHGSVSVDENYHQYSSSLYGNQPIQPKHIQQSERSSNVCIGNSSGSNMKMVYIPSDDIQQDYAASSSVSITSKTVHKCVLNKKNRAFTRPLAPKPSSHEQDYGLQTLDSIFGVVNQSKAGLDSANYNLLKKKVSRPRRHSVSVMNSLENGGSNTGSSSSGTNMRKKSNQHQKKVKAAASKNL